jgi:hypothetical protein
MLAASFISEKLGIMSTEDRAAHDDLVKLLGVVLPAPPTQELKDQVWKRVCGDNKRGYIPLKYGAGHHRIWLTFAREGARPFILAKSVGTMHRPNEYYLEYVPDQVAIDAIEYLLTTFCPQPSQEEGTLRKSSSTSYLSHNRSFQLLTSLVSNWIADFTVGPDGASL